MKTTLGTMTMIAALMCSGFAAHCADPKDTRTRYNVLFIAVDDLKPRVGCYGDPLAKTPNIDRLAAQGMVFDRAYCQQAVCSPSRTALLTGLRPDTTRIYDLNTHFRLNLPNALTLPQHFKQCGYFTQGFSKIYHGGLEDPQSWSVPWDSGTKTTETAAASAKPKAAAKRKAAASAKQTSASAQQDDTIIDPATGTVLFRKQVRPKLRGPATQSPDVADDGLHDGQTAEKAVAALEQLKARNQPFFLAVGFIKPHLPFIAPKKYYDMYPLEKIQLAPNPQPPKDVPEIALTDSGELRNYEDIPDVGPITDDKARELIRGYYAATSYTDAQIGKLLDELERLGLKDNTVVVLWGDHGWQLGEHGLWCKHTNFEEATRSLLVISAPGQKTRGKHTKALVEFVDIYPTLCQLCGLDTPKQLQGTSFAPVLEKPDLKWKSAAFSQYPRAAKNPARSVMGYSMRTDRYRYTEWKDRTTSEVIAAELYDHDKDPGENENLADHADMGSVRGELEARMKAGWEAAKP
jgi:iduronate 2-sulfatase